jgi:hypothetical protein
VTTQSRSTAPSLPLARTTVLGVAGAALVIAVLTGGQVPLASTDRGAFFALLALGWITCTVGAGPTIRHLGWRHPITLAGIALGLVAVGLVAVMLTGLASTPAAERPAFIGLALVLAAKWTLGLAARLTGRHIPA